MYALFIPAAIALVTILFITINDQLGSEPELPMLEQIELARQQMCRTEIETWHAELAAMAANDLLINV